MTHRKLEKVTLTVAVETYGCDNLSSLDHILKALDDIAELSIIDYDTQELELVAKPKKMMLDYMKANDEPND